MPRLNAASISSTLSAFLVLVAFGAAFGAALGVAPVLANPDAADDAVDEDVDRLCFARSINGFRAVEGEDGVVLLETGVNNWYRVEIVGVGCNERDIDRAESVAIGSRPAGGCLTPGDTLIFSDNLFGGDRTLDRSRCAITSISRIDDE